MTTRLAIIVAFTALGAAEMTARADVCDTAVVELDPLYDYCEDSLGWEGCCVEGVVFWCEQYMGHSYTCRLDCATEGYSECGWNSEGGYYFCGNSSSEDPEGTFPHTCPDDDGDGWHVGGDCDDSEAGVYPGAISECDGILDNNCDYEVDSNEHDYDEDDFTECDGDCNDTDALFHPGAYDECGDGIDHDCDQDFESEHDADGDGYAPCSGDCDETNPHIHPAAEEICDDGLDNDCDGHGDGHDTEDCEATIDDDDDGGDDDDLVSPRSGPYGLSCSHSPAGRAATVLTLLTLTLLGLARTR